MTRIIASLFSILITLGCGLRSTGENQLLTEKTDGISPKVILRIAWKKVIPNILEEELTNNPGSYVPLYMQMGKDTIVVSNRNQGQIVFLNYEGKVLGSFSYKNFGVIDVVKFFFKDKTLYLLDPYRGLFVIDTSKNVLLFEDQRTANFFTSASGNIYFQNSLDKRPNILNVLPKNSAFIDKGRILKKPLRSNYYALFVNDTIMIGIKFSENFESSFLIETVNLNDLSIKETLSIDSICSPCFYFPKILSEKLIVASNRKLGRNFIFEVKGKELKKFELNPPNDFRPLIYFEYTPFFNEGVNFEYNQITNELFAIGSDEKEIIIFKYDLKAIIR